MKMPVDLLEDASLRPWDDDANETKPAAAKPTTNHAKTIPPDRPAGLGARSFDDGLSGPVHDLGHRHGAKRPLTTAPDPALRDVEHRLKLGRQPDRLALRARLHTKGRHHSPADDRQHRLPTAARLEVAHLELRAGGPS
jgi:hypothetical protein